jgi:hypothetical protein
MNRHNRTTNQRTLAKLSQYSLFGLVSGALLFATLVLPLPAAADPTIYGLPERLRGLPDLQKVGPRSELTPRQRMEIMLYWLGREMARPSETVGAPGGGVIDSAYIRVQIIMSLAGIGDPVYLDEVQKHHNVSEAIREAVGLALGLAGDRAQIGRMMEIFQHHPQPAERVLAARALGVMGAVEAAPILEQALATKSPEREPHGGVRKIASEELRILKNPDLVAHTQKFYERRREGLAEHRAKAPAQQRAAVQIPVWLLEAIRPEAFEKKPEPPAKPPAPPVPQQPN